MAADKVPMVEYYSTRRASWTPARMLVYVGFEVDDSFERVYCLMTTLQTYEMGGESESACGGRWTELHFELHDISEVNCPKCIVEIEKRFRIKIVIDHVD